MKGDNLFCVSVDWVPKDCWGVGLEGDVGSCGGGIRYSSAISQRQNWTPALESASGT
jgi:hypothetical protein